MRVPRGFTHLSMMVPVNIFNISKKKKKSERVTQTIQNIMHIKLRQLYTGSILASFVDFIFNTHSITDYIRLTPTREQDLVSDMVKGLEYNCIINYKLVM